MQFFAPKRNLVPYYFNPFVLIVVFGPFAFRLPSNYQMLLGFISIVALFIDARFWRVRFKLQEKEAFVRCFMTIGN
jgi:hypothetical protein